MSIGCVPSGEMDYTWSTHPIDFMFDPINGLMESQTSTVLTYGVTLQYSLLYMNANVWRALLMRPPDISVIQVMFMTPRRGLLPAGASGAYP